MVGRLQAHREKGASMQDRTLHLVWESEQSGASLWKGTLAASVRTHMPGEPCKGCQSPRRLRTMKMTYIQKRDW
jgi:hypothetical protein